MSTSPLQPIPEATQPYVDRLIGAQVDDYRLEARTAEGRYGTIYRAQQQAGGKSVSFQVLRTELTGNDEEVRAVKAVKGAGIVSVTGFGQLPDGRRYRVMELLEGESLAQLLDRRGRLPPIEVASILAKVAKVLEAAHAWAIAHGSLGPSSVFVAGDEVKLIDFGLARAPHTTADDLKALGTLGFTLLTGNELVDRVPPPLGDAAPELFDRLLRELYEKRLSSATEARRELEELRADLKDSAPPANATAIVPSPADVANRETVMLPAKPRRTRRLALGVLALVSLGVAAFFAWPPSSDATPPAEATSDDELANTELALDEIANETEGQGEPGVEATTEPAVDPANPPSETTEPGVPRPRPKVTKSVRPPPTARQLMALVEKLERQLRAQGKQASDFEQAMHVLNKQRLALTGSPSVEDRREVARQLAGWRRSYLRR